MLRSNLCARWSRIVLGAMLACGLPLAMQGCGGDEGLPGESGTVTGSLTYNGQPAPEGCTVLLTHKEQGLPASGTVAADGTFELQMRGEADILAGLYEVSVNPPPTAAAGMTDEQAMQQSMDNPGSTPEPAANDWPEVPQKYRAANTSGETFTVEAGSNTFDLDMTDG